MPHYSLYPNPFCIETGCSPARLCRWVCGDDHLSAAAACVALKETDCCAICKYLNFFFSNFPHLKSKFPPWQPQQQQQQRLSERTLSKTRRRFLSVCAVCGLNFNSVALKVNAAEKSSASPWELSFQCRRCHSRSYRQDFKWEPIDLVAVGFSRPL